MSAYPPERFLGFSSEDLRHEGAVVTFFELLSLELRASLRTDQEKELYAATELLLHAHTHGGLSWEHLAAVIRLRLDYGPIFGQYGDELDGPSDFARGTADLYNDHMRDLFVSLLDPTAAWLFVESILEATRGLALRTPDKTGTRGSKALRQADDASQEVIQSYLAKTHALALNYEKAVLAHPDFRKQVIALQKSVWDKEWSYSYDVSPFSGVSPKRRWSKAKGLDREGIDESTLASLKRLCVEWCLESIGISSSSPDPAGIQIQAQRIAVRPRLDGMGLEVFIPRFYRYSHIHRHEKSDFAILRDAMSSIYDAFKKRRKKTP